MKYSIIKYNITPDYPVNMSGYNRLEKSKGALDSIQLNTLCLEIDEQIIVFSYIDSIKVDGDFANNVKNIVSSKTPILHHNINIGATHTHSGPAYFKLAFEETTPEIELKENLKKKIVDSIFEAYNTLENCSINFKKANINDLYGNRNTKEGLSDKSVKIIEFIQNEKVTGALINIAVHPTILKGENYLLSSDLLGHIRDLYEKKINADCIITNGTSGDVSTRFYREDDGIKDLKRISENVVSQIENESVNYKMDWKWKGSAEVSSVVYSDFSKDAITKKLLLQDDNSPYSKMLHDKLNKKISFGKFELHLISNIYYLDDTFIITLPGDVVSEFGNRIQKRLEEYNVLIFCYTNTYANYFVNKEQYGDHFETYNSRLMYGEADKFIDSVIVKCTDLIK